MALIDLSQIKGGKEILGAIDKINGRTIITDVYPSVTQGQTVFPLNQVPNSSVINFLVNGVTYKEGKGYFTINRSTRQLTWTFTEASGGFDIEPEFEISAVYEIGSNLMTPPTFPINIQGKIGLDVTLTYSADAEWESKITQIKRDSNPASTSQYTIQSGKIILKSAFFTGSVNSIPITISANGYDDVRFNLVITKNAALVWSTNSPVTVGEKLVMTATTKMVGAPSGLISITDMDGGFVGFLISGDYTYTNDEKIIFSIPWDVLYRKDVRAGNDYKISYTGGTHHEESTPVVFRYNE